MAKLHIPVGIPGCGKSTFVNRLQPCYVVSTDAIRAEMGDVNDQSRNDEVFDRYHRLLAKVLGNGYDAYADATNLRDFARARLRQIASEAGAETHLWVFANLAQAVVRNQQRERVVASAVMTRMTSQFEKAEHDILHEPYTSITYIDSVR